ncbi:MAG: magnesium transporter [Planctomycetota bacterium]
MSREIEALLSGSELAAAQRLPALLGEARPEDVAEVLTHFDAEDTLRLWTAIPDEDHRVLTLVEADPVTREQIVRALPRRTLIETVERMEPDDAADLLALIDEGERHSVITNLEPETARDVSELLQYPADSAGGIMTSEFVSVGPDRTCQQALLLLQQSFDTEVVAYVYVVDEARRLLGVISLREIIAARPEALIRDHMRREVISADIDLDQEAVARLAHKYNLKSIPVIDASARILGVVTIDDIVSVISEEVDEDIYRMAGSPGDHPLRKRIFSRMFARIPWLVFSLAAGLAIGHHQVHSGRAEGAPEAEVTPLLMLFAFTPLVIGLSGGVATQSSTLITRGLATGEVGRGGTARLLAQEFTIGVGIGVCMGLIAAGLLFALDSLGYLPLDARMPFAIGLGVMGGVVIAAVSGTLIPLACNSLKVDPALVAGPFITSFNDLVGGITYVSIAELTLRM